MKKFLALLIVLCLLQTFCPATQNFSAAQTRVTAYERIVPNVNSIDLIKEISEKSIDIQSYTATSMIQDATKEIESNDVTNVIKQSTESTTVLQSVGSFWAKIYGGNSDDGAHSIQQTIDGGYIVYGVTNSFGAGDFDLLIIKLDSTGNTNWAKTYGGAHEERSWHQIKNTNDGGYIVSGKTRSFGAGGEDVFILKLNSSGSIQWAKTFGGNSSDAIWDIISTSDGSYILGAETFSFGAGDFDLLIIKLDSAGNIDWAKTYGGSQCEAGSFVYQTSDGGYIVSGRTESFGAGGEDVFILKLNSSGSIQWAKTYGGSSDDGGDSVIETSDGGFILIGWTASFGAGGTDSLIIKLDSIGNLLWAKTYGGNNNDECIAYISQTLDGGFIVAGSTDSFGAGGADSLIIKLNSSGSVSWAKTFGGNSNDFATSISQISDGGYIVAGQTNSFSVEGVDFLVLKLDSSGNIPGSSCNFLKDITSSLIVNSATPTVSNQNPQVSSPSLSVSFPTVTVTLPQIQTQTICHSVFPRVYGIPIDFRFKQDLSTDIKGRGPDIRCLQIVLNLDPDTQIAEEGEGSPGNETTAFGKLTQDALKRFQIKYNLPVNGKVDQATRLKLNEILNNIFTDEYKKTYNLLDEEERKSAIVKFIKEYKSKYLPPDFPDEIILAIVAQENGDYAYWNNEFVAGDWGRGLMQVTTDNFVGAGGINSNSEDCLNARDRTKPKIYCSKYYSNTLEGIEVNIRDGLYALGEKYKKKCPKEDKIFNGEIFTCTDIERVLAIWGYNGFGVDESTGEYTGTYLKDVSDKLENLNKYFSNVNLMPDFIKKLRIANDNKETIKIYSPGDIYVSDSKGRITGLLKGQAKEEIPNSTYDSISEAILILFPDDTYTYEVVGKIQGKYSLLLNSIGRGTFSVCTAKDIPIKENEVHQYTIDWNMLAQGEEGVSLNIDLNGDGTFDKNIKSGKEITITEPSQYVIFSSADEGGTISPLGPISVSAGAAQTFIITTYPGYIIKDVKVDGVSIGTVSTYTFTNITFNHTIEATFEIKITTTTIVLTIGSYAFAVNNEIKFLDSPPIIKNSRTLVPIRAIVEALGGTITWHESNKSVDIIFGKNHLILQIGNTNAYVNGVQKFIDPSNLKVVPEIINSRTMLPLRFITENLGCDVQWDDKTKTVIITYKGH